MIAEIQKLMKDDIAGDPISGIKWTRKSGEKISRQLPRALARSDPGLLARRDPPTMHGCAGVGRAGSVVVGFLLRFE